LLFGKTFVEGNILVDNKIGKTSGRRVVVTLGLMTLIAAGGVYWYSTRGVGEGQAARPATRASVPVSVVTAGKQDLPIYLTGLGTVQAVLTVGIHSQVDGKLQEVPFTEGQHVNKGDVLARIDPRLFQAALDQAKARRAEDDAQLAAAEKDLTRFKTLVAKSFETEQNVDLQVAKVDQLKATIDADVAAIETAQTQLDYTTILAPSDGRIGVRLVDPGNVVHASDAGSIAMLVSTNPMTVLFTLPAPSLDDVRQAMSDGAIEVIAYDQDNEKVLSTGKLMMVDNVIDQTTAMFRLKATFANTDERLWPGEFVNARLLLETRNNAVAVPSTAVQRRPEGLFTWVVSEGNTATVHPIEVGPTTGDLTIITSGVSEGDRVVTGGQYKLEPNSQVTLEPAPTPAPVAP
jgi:multidrug efflux system membrane fusion protein